MMQSHCSHIIPNQCFYDLNVCLSAVKGAFLFNCFMNKGGPTLQMHITCHHSVHQFNYFLSRLFITFLRFIFQSFGLCATQGQDVAVFYCIQILIALLAFIEKIQYHYELKGKYVASVACFFVTCHLYQEINNAQYIPKITQIYYNSNKDNFFFDGNGLKTI